MKKIIDGLLYDTEASDLIHTDNSNNRRWFMTKNGAYFLVYPTGEIAPKTVENVQDYLGKHNVEKYIELFGEPKEA